MRRPVRPMRLAIVYAAAIPLAAGVAALSKLLVLSERGSFLLLAVIALPIIVPLMIWALTEPRQ